MAGCQDINKKQMGILSDLDVLKPAIYSSLKTFVRRGTARRSDNTNTDFAARWESKRLCSQINGEGVSCCAECETDSRMYPVFVPGHARSEVCHCHLWTDSSSYQSWLLQKLIVSVIATHLIALAFEVVCFMCFCHLHDSIIEAKAESSGSDASVVTNLFIHG